MTYPSDDIGFADLTEDDLYDWREASDYDDYEQEEPRCMACGDSGFVAVRWPRWLRWFRPNHSWDCPWCRPTRFDRALWLVMNPIWRTRAFFYRTIRNHKSNDEAPF